MNNWNTLIDFTKYDYILKKVEYLRKTNTIYPKDDEIFKAFELTKLDNLKVVLLGQDPYHEENQAHGLAFSVNYGCSIPPSLRNIFKELQSDLGYEFPKHGNLTKWALNGVLLLNTTLTVIEHQALSLSHLGWDKLTDEVISKINELNKPIVFILLGNHAKSKKRLITNERHLIIEANHPSPLSAYRGFFGCKMFSKTNDFLIKNNILPIDWRLE